MIVSGTITTDDLDDGTVRGSISLTADDAVTIGANISTAGLGMVTITANDSSADGDNNGALTMNAGTIITAANGNVTLQTIAVVGDVDEGTITVAQITTTGGNVLIDANGINADVLLTNTITTGNGKVTVQANDTVMFQAAGMIDATGAGDVVVQANQDALDGDGNDELLMADGSVINSGTGTATLRTDGANGGNITLGRVVTQNATAGAVTINSQMAVLDGGDTGGADIESLAAASTINITAVTGIGTLAMRSTPAA